MTHSRNHLTPAFIIKRFKPSKDTVDLYFPEFSAQYESKKKPPVIKINKSDLLVESGIIDFKSHQYTNSKSDHFIKNEIYFFKEEFLKRIQECSENENVKDFLSKIEDKSLEVSFNEYESKMSLILDKYLDENFHDLPCEDTLTITKFIDSSHSRPLKYKKIEEYLKRFDNDPAKFFCSFMENADFLSNIDSFNENKTFDEIVIGFLIILDFVKHVTTEHKEFFEKYLSQIPLLFHMLKNNEDIDKLEKTNIIYVQSEFDNLFILGDNTVYTLYSSDHPSVIDHINQYLKEYNFIERDLNKLSIIVVSPNNIIIKSDELIYDQNIKVNSSFVKMINTITLFSTDEWIVTKNVIKNINDIIYPKLLDDIKDFNFFENSIVKLLSVLNYDIGIDNKYHNFDKEYLNSILEYIDENVIPHFINNKEITKYALRKSIVDINFIYANDMSLLFYFMLKVKIALKKYDFEVLVYAYKVIEIDPNDNEKFKYEKYDLDKIDININYDFLCIEIQE